MYKSNPQRNGQANDEFRVSSIGEIQWRLESIQLLSADKNIAFKSDSLYCIATRDNPLRASFYSINAENGQIDWSIEIDKEDRKAGGHDMALFCSPVIVNKLAYFLYKPIQARLRPVLYCIDIVSRKILFITDIHKSMGKKFVDGTIDEFKRLLRSSILVVGDSIYIGTGNGYICCFDAITGKLKWSLLITNEFAIGHIAYCDGFLYAQSGSRDLYAVDISKRSIKWSFKHDEEYKVHIDWYNTCPLVLGDVVYIYGSLKSLYAVERKTGKLLWQYSVNGLFPYRSFVGSDNLLIGAMPDSTIHAIDARTGEKVWVTSIGGNAFSSPVIIGDTVFVSNGGYFYGLCTATGKKENRWEIPFDLSKSSNPFYLVVQLVNSVTKITTGSPGFSSISSPCITEQGIFLATEVEPDCSIYKLNIRTAPATIATTSAMS